MVNVKISEDVLVDVLMDRLDVWNPEPEVKELYEKMYRNYAENGCFDGVELDVMQIVDNDWVNYCDVIDESNEVFKRLLEVYKENGLTDISCEDGVDGYSFIEAVDDEEEPKLFLVRC